MPWEVAKGLLPGRGAPGRGPGVGADGRGPGVGVCSLRPVLWLGAWKAGAEEGFAAGLGAAGFEVAG